ncbi:MAG: secretion system protein E [Alphaproteobacteria bacterium]|nr:secretion system protein E [Alphaproteobacteria bacterium]
MADIIRMRDPMTPQSRPDGVNGARLGERLVAGKRISTDQLRIALHEQRVAGGLLGEALIKLGFINASLLAETLADSGGYRRIDIRTAQIDMTLAAMVPKTVARQCRAIPLVRNGDRIELAMADPFDIMALDQMRHHMPAGCDLVPCVADLHDLMAGIEQHYGDDAVADRLLQQIEGAGGFAEHAQASIHPVIELADHLIEEAVRVGASDLHFEPEAGFVRLRYRIDGILHPMQLLHRDHWPAIAQRLKIMAGMNIANSRFAQDGRFSMQCGGRTVDFRVSLLPTIWGENIVIRVLDHRQSLLPLDTLGFNAQCLGAIRKMLKRPAGMVLVTGPTGSGKTTTLYGILRAINSIGINVMTLEEPVEYQLGIVRQTQVREQHGLGFAEGVRAVMRQDPDVIFIGEIRDHETAQMALRAAMTGHRVFSTLHTNGALGVLPRLCDLGLQPGMLAGNFTGVVAQRLVRMLCPDCKRLKPVTPEERRMLRLDRVETLPPMIGSAQGCPACRHTGYRGRTVVAEVLRVTPALEDLFAKQASRRALLGQAQQDGYRPMIEDGTDKVLAGSISLESLGESVDMTERM